MIDSFRLTGWTVPGEMFSGLQQIKTLFTCVKEYCALTVGPSREWRGRIGCRTTVALQYKQNSADSSCDIDMFVLLLGIQMLTVAVLF